MEYNDEKATVLSRKEVYPEGADYPTIVTEYACACGEGKIVTHDLPGFDDYTVKIQCEQCSKKYRLRTGCGHLWELAERN